MARKYTRDNRGRFASGGGGATARGGRLKTAGGNKRATQTMRAQGAGGDGVIRGRAARTVAGESVMRKLPKAAPKAVVTGKGARLGGEGAKAVVATKQAAYRSASAKSRAAGKESAKYGYKNEPYNPKNFFGGSAVRAANMAKASPEKLAEFKSLQKASSAFSRNRLKAGKASVELSNKAYGMKGAANASRPGTMLRPKAAKPAAPAQAKAAPKAATATKPTLKRTGETIKKPRARPPATTLQYKQAVPVTNANRPRRDRASAVMQRSVSGTVGFPEMQKLRIKAGVAANPYSDMSKGQRTKAANNLANAELQNKKASKSYGIGAKAYDIYTNLAGHTQGEGRKKWRRAGQRATSLGAGTIRGGARRSDKPVSAPAGNTQRQSRSRLWYETKGKRK